VTPQRVADVLLAAGASPAMIDNPDEVGQFAGLADMLSGGLYLNTGLHSSQMSAMSSVADWRKSSADGVLVVDPVGYGATAWRSAAIEQMLSECRPDAIKGNASEIVGLSGAQVSSQFSPTEHAPGRQRLALQPAVFTRACVAANRSELV
jgi:hydroxyethylthiazole kinase